MSDLYLGMISGTSVDGVDAVLVELGDRECRVVRASTTPFPADLLARLQALIVSPQTTLRELGSLDVALGRFFARCALELLAGAGVEPGAVVAIGSHGQTVFHEPTGNEPFTLQLGDPNVIAAETRITTVADFRRLDVALGGQGAPLVPAFHAWRFADPAIARVVVNVGGIANVTVLAPGKPVIGFDTGPGNTLLDRWIAHCRNLPFDRDGAWAGTGHVDEPLLEAFLADPYFHAAPPKSTGREHFNRDWLDRRLAGRAPIPDADVQATLAELTARSIAASIRRAVPDVREIVVCGGGAHNADLMGRLERAAGASVATTERFGLSPDFVEGAAFAWLARARLLDRPGNVPTVTGARMAAVLGGVYSGPQR